MNTQTVSSLFHLVQFVQCWQIFLDFSKRLCRSSWLFCRPCCGRRCRCISSLIKLKTAGAKTSAFIVDQLILWRKLAFYPGRGTMPLLLCLRLGKRKWRRERATSVPSLFCLSRFFAPSPSRLTRQEESGDERQFTYLLYSGATPLNCDSKL